MPQMTLPQHLGHQPVFAVPYFDHDGQRAGDTDAQFLSVGWAQYDQHELAAKVMRHPGTRWSRQSEEMPLTRVVDLATLIALSLLHHNDTGIALPAGTLENQADEVSVLRTDASHKRAVFSRELSENLILRRRLGVLADVLSDLRKQGAI